MNRKGIGILLIASLLIIATLGVSMVFGAVKYAPSECIPYIEEAMRSPQEYTDTRSGLPSEVTYAAIGIAVIAIIAAALLVMRKK